MKYQYVETNIGLVPLDDYLDMKACQYGYDSYEDLKAEGLSIKISPEDIVERDE